MNKNKLVYFIEEITELEQEEAQLSIGIFLRIAENMIKENIFTIESILDSKIKLYNVKLTDVEENKKEILQRYREEFNKISESFQKRFINIQHEIVETEANQKIVLANLAKALEIKKDEESLKKRNACIEKYNNYNKIIDECTIEANICIKELKEALNSVMDNLQEKQLVKISKIKLLFDRFLNKFSGKKKFKAYVINKMQSELDNLEKLNITLDENEQEKNFNFIATIYIMRKNINNQFKLAIS